MGGSDAEQGAADYGHLPSDVLHLIFQSLLHPPGECMLPLSMCYKQWVYLRLCCKHWGEVSTAHHRVHAAQLGCSCTAQVYCHVYMMLIGRSGKRAGVTATLVTHIYA